ncbi:uncharacterized protein A1O9_07799 [Exophiala aquamarina CBS 119918]|uniref:BRCT domain-containing protein n=1 Tax=Exophiala aquamarina CBS 119918 TaxID=1182545 RepID=A0A072PAC6_9EURO|nr:uncharacterized protein A1O9_07799 [Exophiala aquamarina CBS 119918]KEF56218.1 hypothetical protein A1O9_07799 [Exophiala aquamarina CBS 119918]
MDVEKPSKAGLFAQCSFAIVRSATFTSEDAEATAIVLRLHEGEVVIDNYPDSSLNLDRLTHVISNTSDFPDYHACSDAMIPVVKPIWIEHSLAKDKLSQPRQYSPDPRFFMSDIVVCVSGLPGSDADAIAGGVVAMGGMFSKKLTNQITHIIAIDYNSEICDIARKKGLRVKIVLPHWVDDCLKLGRRIDEHPYTFPNPEILQQPVDKAPSAKRKTQVEGAVNFDPAQHMLTSGTPRKLDRVFKKKTVLLSYDLGISSYLRGVLDGIITGSGGKLTESVSEADMYIGKYRDGRDYKLASRLGKDVGNLTWLYYLIQTDEWTSPMRRLLHYPIPKEAHPDFEKLKISLSNYSGDARTYLENLIIATGAECTKTLKQDNTHLLTAHGMSEKCAAAKDWGIDIVNHLWLEESYAKWRKLSVTNSRYIHFPSRTNLSDVVGSTQLDRTVLEQNFFADIDAEMAENPQTALMRQTNQNTAKTSRGREKSSDSCEREPEKFRTPAVSKFIAMGKENITPSTTHSRKSKEVASALLHAMTPDIQLYEKERKRVGGVIHGGRRKNDEDRIPVNRKRSASESSENEIVKEKESKKLKRGNPPQIYLMVSGYDKWVSHPKAEDNDKKQLRGLGILTTTDASKATHLAAPSIKRTQKFVTALAYAPMVLSTDFIDSCLKADRLLDPRGFELDDKQNEKRLGVSLKLSRDRAKKNQNRLLQGLSIYCAESIHGGFETFKAIVEANGGRCMLWRNRKSAMMPSTRAESEASTDTDDSVVYLLSDKEGNKSLCDRFRDMALKSRKTPRIIDPDWLIESAMSQKLLPTATYDVESGERA